MTSWTARMHRRATTFSNVVTSCGQPSGPYSERIEKVKFGVPVEELCRGCKNHIPGPLIILLIRLTKEGPDRKDVFRAPGHQGAMKKLIHFLQTGKLINMYDFSMYTIASVLKKLLRKIPGGIFGKEVEERLFHVLDIEEEWDQRTEIENIMATLPSDTRRLLAMIFGAFRAIADKSEEAGTGMTSEALGVSVAPSFFHSCVSDGKAAKMEDVMKFKSASRVVRLLIEQYYESFLFGKEYYAFFSEMTGHEFYVQGNLVYPVLKLKSTVQQENCPNEYETMKRRYNLGHLSLGRETWLQCENDRWRGNYGREAMSQVEGCQSTPALLESGTQPQDSSTSLGMIVEPNLLESCTRLSISLEENGLFQGNNTSHSSSASQVSRNSQNYSGPKMTLEELRAVNQYAESTRSLSYLPQVHERQTERMKTRSRWFLTPSVECSNCGGSLDIPLDEAEVSALTTALLRHSSSGTIVGITGLSLSAESVQKRPSIRRSNSRDKRHFLYRSTSRKNKSGSRSNSFKGRSDRRGSCSRSGSFKIKYENISRSCSFKTKTELCSCPTGDVKDDSTDGTPTAKRNETICVTLTYKPRFLQ